MRGFRTVSCLAILAACVVAQPPLQLNTTVRSFTSVPANPWVADIWSYTDTMGRDFALVCRGNSGMSCYEITNPTAPVFASSITATGSDMKDVKVMQNPPTAFALQQGTETRVVDLSNPYNMQVIATIPGGAHNGFVYEEGPTKLYFQARNGASPYNLRIYDVTNPANPTQVGSWQPPGSSQTHDVYVQDDTAYVNCLFGGSNAATYVLDVSNPASPVQIGVIPSGPLSHSGWMYNPPGDSSLYYIECNETAGGHVLIFDATDPANPVLATEVFTPTGSGISIHNPVVVGRYCYISWYADYLRILDMGNPSNPIEVGVYDPNPTNVGAAVYDGAWGVAYVKEIPGGHRVLLTESFATNRGFWVIDFTPPEKPSLDISTSGAGDVTLAISGAAPNSLMFNAVSFDTSGLLGNGPVGGIGGDALFSLAWAPGTQPYVVFADGSGNYNFSAPAGSVPPGISCDVVNFSQTPSNGWQISEIGRIDF